MVRLTTKQKVLLICSVIFVAFIIFCGGATYGWAYKSHVYGTNNNTPPNVASANHNCLGKNWGVPDFIDYTLYLININYTDISPAGVTITFSISNNISCDYFLCMSSIYPLDIWNSSNVNYINNLYNTRIEIFPEGGTLLFWIIGYDSTKIIYISHEYHIDLPRSNDLTIISPPYLPTDYPLN